jgi:TonB family protein
MADNLMASAMLKPGTIEFALKGSVPTESSAPRLTRAVEVEISNQDLAKQPTVSNVVIRAIVDVNGIPRNVAITQSAGSLIDEKAIAAVNQYRFQPATLDNKPTWATVSISIKIQKP